jgi:hypothetical protein
MAAATGVLTFAADPAATDEVTIGGITYVFIATPGAAYDVDVGGTREESVLNLIAAINRSGTPGATTYHADTVAHPDVTAELSDTDEITITARIAGLSGNSIATATSEIDITWAAANMTGGTGRSVSEVVDEILASHQPNSAIITLLHELTAAAD